MFDATLLNIVLFLPLLGAALLLVSPSAHDAFTRRLTLLVMTMQFALTATERTPVMVDYAIHHAGATGRRSAKVFKLKRTVLEPGIETAFRREHRIREVSVRRIHPGPHLMEIQVNGKVLAETTVEVLP